MTMILAPQMIGSMKAYGISNAALFDGSTGYLSHIPASDDGDTWTISFWILKYNPDLTVDASLFEATDDIRFNTSEQFNLRTGGIDSTSTEVFRDCAGWMHIHIKCTGGTPVLKVNNRIIALSMTPNFTHINSAILHRVGYSGLDRYAPVYLADYHFISNAAVEAMEFAKTDIKTGNWVPKKIADTLDLGQNGFIHKYDDADNLGKSERQPNGIRVATFNSAIKVNGGTLENSNRTLKTTGTNTIRPLTLCSDTMLQYVEFKCVISSHVAWGVKNIGARTDQHPSSGLSEYWYIYSQNGIFYYYDDATNSYSPAYSAPAVNDVLQVAYDPVNGYIWCGNDDVWFDGTGGSTGNPSTGTNPTFTGIGNDCEIFLGTSNATVEYDVKVLESEWTYSAPTAFKALTSNNLPKVSDNVDNHFIAQLRTGTGAIASVTGLPFSPTAYIGKSRNNAYDWGWQDIVRGTTKDLNSNNTAAEETRVNSITSFDSNGVTFGAGDMPYNGNGSTMVDYFFNLPDATIPSGFGETISLTGCRSNAVFGMAIATWTGNGVAGAMIPHPLGKKPGFIIIKNLDQGEDWYCYHSAVGATKYLTLNATHAAVTTSTVWNDTEPTSELITLGTNTGVNNNGQRYVAYIFVQSDFIKIGSYIGNGDVDGPFINEMVSPVWSLLKDSSGAGNWYIWDDERTPFNPMRGVLLADLPITESTAASWDTYDTAVGKKIRSTAGGVNVSNNKHIYMMIGEPSVNALLDGADYQTVGTVTQVTSTPTNVAATWNPMAVAGHGSVYSNGNRTSQNSGGYDSHATLLVEDKVYFEVTVTSGTTLRIGMASLPLYNYDSLNWTSATGAGGVINTGVVYVDGVTGATYTSFTTGDRVGVAFDPATRKFWYRVNGGAWVNSGDPAAGTGAACTLSTGTTFVVTKYSGSSVTTAAFAEAEWVDAAPDGFKALTTNSLPKVSDSVDNHFKTVLFTGNGVAIGSGGNPVTGVGFQPDFVWGKNRNNGSSHHFIYDACRGATKNIRTNQTNAEATNAEGISSFDSDGFTVGADAEININGDNSVAWCANLPNTKISGWSDSPTITPSKEIYNDTLGMSIVTYTGNGVAGATIPHSLGVTPGMVMIKTLSIANTWAVGHDAEGWAKVGNLDNTNAFVLVSTVWNDTAPTDQLITLGTNGAVNASGEKYVAYIFAPSDFIKIGSYTGNGSTDGPFVNEMVSPVWMLFKRTDSVDSWTLRDSARDPHNPVVARLDPNSSAAESNSTVSEMDFTAVGIKHRENDPQTNASGGTYIYMMIGQPQGPKENPAR